MSLLWHYYIYFLFFYFSDYVTSDHYFFNYVTIITLIPIIFPIIFDYFRGSQPNWQELADTNSRPVRRAMTEKCPGAPAVLWDEQESSRYQDKSTFPAEQRLLYALFFLLYLLFWMSDQDWAACNLDLRNARRHTTNLWDASCRGIKKKALLAVTRAQFMPFSFVLFTLCHYYLLLLSLFPKLKTAIWVRIHCRILANRHIHHRWSVSIQTKSIKVSIVLFFFVLEREGDRGRERDRVSTWEREKERKIDR